MAQNSKNWKVETGGTGHPRLGRRKGVDGRDKPGHDVDCAAPSTSLRANGSRECAPDDRLREAIQRHAGRLDCFVARAPRKDGDGIPITLSHRSQETPAISRRTLAKNRTRLACVAMFMW